MMSTRDSVTAAHYVGVHIIRVRSSLCVFPAKPAPDAGKFAGNSATMRPN